MNEDNVRRLPMFPTPYPGESFYSVLCRYHVRSCNARDSDTFKQLFGKPRCIASTLLTPFRLPYVRKWVSRDSGISPENMLYGNTAFPFISVTLPQWEEAATKKRVISDADSTASNGICRKQKKMMPKSLRLRFCPACARAQEKLYGEAYWQVLPQVDGVEYCPIHGEQILSSRISLSDIQRHFRPASEGHLTTTDPQKTEVHWTRLSIPKNRLIQLSFDMQWIFENARRLPCLSGMFNLFRKKLSQESDWRDFFYVIELRRLFRKLREAMTLDAFACLEEELLKYSFSPNCIQLDCVPIGLLVFLMGELSGSAQNFYTN